MSKSTNIKLEEDLLASNADKVKNEFVKIINKGIDKISIDMANVSMVDSTGLSVLIAIQNTLRKKDGILELLNVSDDILRLFKITRLDQHFSVK